MSLIHSNPSMGTEEQLSDETYPDVSRSTVYSDHSWKRIIPDLEEAEKIKFENSTANIRVLEYATTNFVVTYYNIIYYTRSVTSYFFGLRAFKEHKREYEEVQFINLDEQVD